MANSTTHIDGIVASQSAKEVTANAFFDAASQAATYGRRASTSSGLTWGYYGGNVVKADGVLAQIANGTLTLTASATNYIVAAKATGAVSVSTASTNWDNATDYWRLYSVVAGASSVTSYTDHRVMGWLQMGTGSVMPVTGSVMPVNTQSGATYTLSAQDAGRYIRMTSGDANKIIVPSNDDAAIQLGGVVKVRQAGAGKTTIEPAAGVAINTPAGLSLRAMHSDATLIKIAANAWDIAGDLEPAVAAAWDAAWDAATKGANITLSNSDLTAQSSDIANDGTADGNVRCTLGKSSGKWYAEITVDAVSTAGGNGAPFVGVADSVFTTSTSTIGSSADSSQGRFANSLGGSGNVGGFTVGDVICVAYDADSRKVWLRKNSGAWAGGGNPAAGTTPHKTLSGTGALYVFAQQSYASRVTVNFGGAAFAYTPPVGFVGIET